MAIFIAIAVDAAVVVVADGVCIDVDGDDSIFDIGASSEFVILWPHWTPQGRIVVVF